MFCFQCYSDLDSSSFPHLCSLKELDLVALTAGIILVPGKIITNQNCKYILMYTWLPPFKTFILHLSLGMTSALF